MLFSNQSFKGDQKTLEIIYKRQNQKTDQSISSSGTFSYPHDRKDQVFLNVWVKITSSQRALNIVEGYKPQFLAEPFQSFLPKTFVRNHQEAKIIEEEIDTLLEF